MKRKNLAVIAVVIAVIVVGIVTVIHLYKNELPMDADKIHQIVFLHYPQNTENYTVTNAPRIKEIVDTINALDIATNGRLPNGMSDQYYSLIFFAGDGSEIGISLDEQNISVQGECYLSDTSALTALLTQTYYDNKNGIIEIE